MKNEYAGLLHGIDLVEVERFRDLISRRPTIINRLFCESEISYCNKSPDPSERYAVRFAAKEAIIKALGRGLWDISFKDVRIEKDPRGKPEVVLSGRALALSQGYGVDRWIVSLSHTGSAAMASVIGLASQGTSAN